MNLLAKVNAAREVRVKDLHLDLPIPTWEGNLVARFNVLDRKVVEKFGNATRNVDSDCDYVISALREIYLKDTSQEQPGTRMDAGTEDEDLDFVRIEDDKGLPVAFDTRLAEALGKPDLKTAREVLIYLHGGNAIAVAGLVQRLAFWMDNTDRKIGDSLMGES